MLNFRDEISLFCGQVKQRRFDEATLQVLQSILVSKDLQSLLEIRSSLKEFLRSESTAAIREIAEKPIQHKLLILEFFVHAFAIVNDFEACGYALACLRVSSVPTGKDLVNEDAIGSVKRLKHVAMAFSATHSIQVQTAEYLKKKSIKSLKHTSFCKETEYSSSTAFRNGIKKRNERNLQQHQRLQKLYEN
ncbi:hypothetical protein Ancab_011723 [Ancistrocladus abbreviatus]